jgi:hypothetical protein
MGMGQTRDRLGRSAELGPTLPRSRIGLRPLRPAVVHACSGTLPPVMPGAGQPSWPCMAPARHAARLIYWGGAHVRLVHPSSSSVQVLELGWCGSLPDGCLSSQWQQAELSPMAASVAGVRAEEKFDDCIFVSPAVRQHRAERLIERHSATTSVPIRPRPRPVW